MRPFERWSSQRGDEMRILDKTGTVRWQDSGDDTRPEVDRGALREILLQSLPAHCIHWGSKVTNVVKLEGGRHEVRLASGETFTTALLIGADGAWSKVRPLLSDAQPIYLGISFIETHLLDADVRHPEIAALVGRGSMFALSDEKGLITHRDGDGRITVYIALKTPEHWVTSSGIDFRDTEAARLRLLNHFLAGMTRYVPSLPRVIQSFFLAPSTRCQLGTAGNASQGSRCLAMPLT